MKKKSKITAGLLGIFLGALGVHNFYIGSYGKAIAQLLITVLSAGALAFISLFWGLAEGILILTNCIDINQKYRKEQGTIEENKEFAKETFKRFNSNRAPAIDYIKKHTRLSVEEIQQVEKEFDLEKQEIAQIQQTQLEKETQEELQCNQEPKVKEVKNNTQTDAKYVFDDVSIYDDRVEETTKKGTKIIKYNNLKSASISMGMISLEDLNGKFYSIFVDKAKKQEILEMIKSKIPEINHLEEKEDIEFIKEKNFEVSKNLILYRVGILVDDINKQILVKSYNEPLKIYNYTDILKYELCIDENNVSKGSAFNTYMGGQVFGLYGALGELANAQKTKKICKSLIIRITLKDITSNQVILPIVHYEMNTDSRKFQTKLEQAQNICAVLENIIEGQRASITKPSERYTELKELNDLLKDGIISKEEFEEQKNKILKR